MWVSGAIIFAVIHAVTSNCPKGFEHHGDDCYKVHALEASWIEAKMYCRLEDADLVEIHTAAEEKMIEGIITSLHHSHIDERYWMDGTDIVAENDWRWMHEDGQSKSFSYHGNYTNWGNGQPDNAGGREHCLTIVYAGAKTHWSDERCSIHHSFICEAPWNATGAALVG